MTDPAAAQISDPVTVPSPLRVLVTAAATAAWYDTTDEPTRRRVAARWREVIAGWVARPGVRILTTFDDDLLLAGDPRPFGRWSIFIVLEAQALDDAVAVVDDMRHGDIRLHTYFTVNAAVGRSFWPADEYEGKEEHT
jgi:hypothetical protein